MKILKILFLLPFLTGCQEDNLPPVAKCKSFPTFGDTTILFELDASKSIDDNGLKNGLTYRWDFDGDTVWDTGYQTENSIGHYFINPGTYRVIVEVSDFAGLSDTASTSVTVFGRNKDIGTLTDPRDGQSYRIVKVRDTWWMAENLRFGTRINKNIEQKDNGIVEMYQWSAVKYGDTIGGSYRWQEAMNYNMNSDQGICPPGWHIPNNMEWEELLKGMPMWYSVRFYGKDGLSELNLQISNQIVRIFGDIQLHSFYQGGFWSSHFDRTENLIIPGRFFFDSQSSSVEIGYQVQSGPENSTKYVQYFSLRCRKN